MNTKQKGNRREHQTMRLLESEGYSCCRSSASLGAWDVIAIGDKDVQVVQVKSNRNPPTKEMKVMREFVVPPGVIKVLHVWKDGSKVPVITII